MKLKSLPSITFLLLSLFAAIPSVVPQSRAATTGLLCISDQSLNPIDCTSSPAHLTGATGDTITVAVNVQGLDSFNGFDISVQADPAVLRPVSVSLSDSLIQEPRFVVRQTVNSINGVAYLAVVALGHIVAGPVTGNLFEIVYKVLSSTKSTAIIFVSGCSNTSVQGMCVSFAYGDVLLYVTLQTANFGLETPDFFISWVELDPASWVLLDPGSPELVVQAGFSGFVAIALISVYGFGDTVAVSTGLSACSGSACPSLSLSSATVALPPYGTSFTTLTVTVPPEQFGSPKIYWDVKVTGTAGGRSHSAILSITVWPPDVTISVDQRSSLAEPVGNATIILHSIGGFGTVNLAYNPDAASYGGASCSLWSEKCQSFTWNLSSTRLDLSAGETAQTTLTFSTQLRPDELTFPISYEGIVTASSGNLSNSVEIHFMVLPTNFTTTLNPATLILTRGQSSYVRVWISSWFPVSTSVSLSPTVKRGPVAKWPYYPCTGDCSCYYDCGPFLLVSTNSTTHPGTYTATLTVNNGWFTHTATLTVAVVANVNDPPKDR